MTADRNLDLLREFLKRTDPACPGCGYNLRGLASAACPECNEALQLQVGLVQPRLLPFVGAVSGLSAGAGAAFLWLVTATVLSIAMHDWPPWPWLAVPGIALVLEGGAMLSLLRVRGRVWFRKTKRRGRIAAIVGAWGATVGWIGVFVTGVIVTR
jgi:hypothetical protein